MSKAWRSIGFSFAVGAFLAAAAHAQAPAPATPAPAATAAPATASATDGQTLLQSDCTSCHDLAPINAHGRTPQEWSDLVDRMVTYGASGSDADIAAIKAYLAANLPPSAAAPPAAPLAGPASNTQ
jgi:mono/diheme cytochrome c family protein